LRGLPDRCRPAASLRWTRELKSACSLCIRPLTRKRGNGDDTAEPQSACIALCNRAGRPYDPVAMCSTRPMRKPHSVLMPTRLVVLALWLVVIALAGCSSNNTPDVIMPEGGTPAACASCPNDCCRLGDGGVACLNWSHRNPLTLECSCGNGPACDQSSVCCPPTNDPQPQLPPACLTAASLCDPRPQP